MIFITAAPHWNPINHFYEYYERTIEGQPTTTNEQMAVNIKPTTAREN